jgi:hypothetical protein
MDQRYDYAHKVWNQQNKNAKEKYSVDKAAYDATKTPGVDAVTTPAPVGGLVFLHGWRCIHHWDSQVEKKVVKAPVKATPKPEFKSAPLVQSSASSVSASDESSEDDDEDDDDDEEVEEEPALKKKKATPLVTTPALKEKKQRKHWEYPLVVESFFYLSMLHFSWFFRCGTASFGYHLPTHGTAVDGCVCHSLF